MVGIINQSFGNSFGFLLGVNILSTTWREGQICWTIAFMYSKERGSSYVFLLPFAMANSTHTQQDPLEDDDLDLIVLD